jgi:cyclic beta-1,2-glucan synthetase
MPTLEFFNGTGGFAADGQEYVTILRDGQCTPAPWINVVANPGFGFQVSAEGGGYTWAGSQSREPAHPLVERSGRGPARRGHLSARR